MTDTPGSKMPIWLTISLVVNALLIGLLVGGGLGKRRADLPPPPAVREMSLARGLDQSLSGNERRTVRRAMREAYAQTRVQRDALRQAQRDLSETLSADPYDEASVKQRFAQVRAADEQFKLGLHEALAVQLGQLSADQRRAIVHRIVGDSRRGQHRHRRHESEDDTRGQAQD